MVMGSRMQHGSAQPTAAHALQGKRNARVVRCDEDNAQPAAAYALQRYEMEGHLQCAPNTGLPRKMNLMIDPHHI